MLTIGLVLSITRRVIWYALQLLMRSSGQANKILLQWIVVDSRVYDVSKFANLHPGGAAVLLVDTIGALLVPPLGPVCSCEEK